jgi:uncharacterized membrane protein
MHGCLAVGIVGYVLGLRVELPIAALAVYWAGCLGFLGVRRASAVTLYDERHAAIRSRAAERTLQVAGAGLILVAPALPALPAPSTATPRCSSSTGPSVSGCAFGRNAR